MNYSQGSFADLDRLLDLKKVTQKVFDLTVKNYLKKKSTDEEYNFSLVRFCRQSINSHSSYGNSMKLNIITSEFELLVSKFCGVSKNYLTNILNPIDKNLLENSIAKCAESSFLYSVHLNKRFILGEKSITLDPYLNKQYIIFLKTL